MCRHENTGCQIPEKLKGKPEECSPEQIKECHGEGAQHTCVDSKKKEWRRIRPKGTGFDLTPEGCGIIQME